MFVLCLNVVFALGRPNGGVLPGGSGASLEKSQEFFNNFQAAISPASYLDNSKFRMRCSYWRAMIKKTVIAVTNFSMWCIFYVNKIFSYNYVQ
jgi:hypothetical protein